MRPHPSLEHPIPAPAAKPITQSCGNPQPQPIFYPQSPGTQPTQWPSSLLTRWTQPNNGRALSSPVRVGRPATARAHHPIRMPLAHSAWQPASNRWYLTWSDCSYQRCQGCSEQRFVPLFRGILVSPSSVQPTGSAQPKAVASRPIRRVRPRTPSPVRHLDTPVLRSTQGHT